MSILKTSWDNATAEDRLELVFENRNRAYGAFQIRREYQKVMIVAFFAGIAGLLFAYYAPAIIKMLTPKETEVKVVKQNNTAQLMEPPPMDDKKPPPPPPEIKLPELKQVNFTPPVIKPDDEITQEVATIEEVKTAVIGTENKEGDTVGTYEPVQNQVVEEEEKPYLIVEQMPEFPGGQDAMMRFINENIQYPPIARDNNVSGRVVLTFVVDQSGSINDIKVLRAPDGDQGDLRDEAIRVVKKMPPWKPGKQNGKAVKVQFNLPIMFDLR